MANIIYKNLMAFMSEGKEQIILQWEDEGVFRECTLYRKFDTKKPWKIKENDVDKATLIELLKQFTEQLAYT